MRAHLLWLIGLIADSFWCDAMFLGAPIQYRIIQVPVLWFSELYRLIMFPFACCLAPDCISKLANQLFYFIGLFTLNETWFYVFIMHSSMCLAKQALMILPVWFDFMAREIASWVWPGVLKNRFACLWFLSVFLKKLTKRREIDPLAVDVGPFLVVVTSNSANN